MRRFVLFLMCAPAVPAAADDVSPAAVEAARQRQERLRTVYVAWKVTAFMPKGGRMDADPVGLPLPREDVTVESTHRLVLDGDRFRAEHDDPGFGKQVSGDGDGVRAFDGELLYRRLYEQGRGQLSHLFRERAASRAELGGLTVRPLALWCRGAQTEPYGDPEHGTRAVGEAKIDGETYLEVRITRPPGGSASYLLDPRRDYVVRRVRQEFPPSAEVTDVGYRRDSTTGWLPERWTWTKTRAGEKLVERMRAEVTEVRLNEPVPLETFRLDPLPGELLTDHGSGKTYQVRADGNPEELDPAGGARALAEPARPTLPAWPGRQLVRYVVIPSLLIAVIALIVLRRRRAHTPSP